MVTNSNHILKQIHLEYITDIPSFIEDIPGMRLTNAVGEYEITTQRRERKKEMLDGTIKRNHDFQVMIKLLMNREEVVFMADREELITKSFGRAVKTHYAIINYLNKIYPR